MIAIESARSHVSIPVFVEPVNGAQITVLLLPGGAGGIGVLSPEGRPNGRNFLIRSGEYFRSAGFNVAMMSKPSDRAELDNAFRVSADHMDDIRKTLAYLKQRLGAPVWVVGTSRGSTSAASAAIALRDEGLIAGVVLTSSITSYRIPQAVTRLALEKIHVPALVVHHENDGCKQCQPHEAGLILQGLTQAPRKQLIMVSGGKDPSGDPCEALHYHGYIGYEPETVALIADWIQASSTAPWSATLTPASQVQGASTAASHAP